MARVSPSSESLYDDNAEFYDVASTERAASLTADVHDWASGVPAGMPLVDLGAGTGRLTVVAARATASEVFAVEPSRAMRAVLASRIADDRELTQRVSIVSSPTPAAWRRVPDTVGGVMMLAALPHLRSDDRRSLLGAISSRLAPDGTALIEVMQPWTSTPIPRQRFVSVPCGRHRVEGEMEATPFDEDGLDWTMTYRRVDADGSVLDETTNSVSCWVVSPDQLTDEATAAGLSAEWRTDELAVLRRR